MEYAFNDYGEKTALRTFRAGTGDFTTSAWPLSDDSDPKNPNAATWTSGDKTTWVYETPTGLLLSKTDAGTTSQAPQTVAYTYNARGQLATRVWARGVTTTYAYSSTTAEQTGITYSDSTPALSYTYNRLGQSATVGDVTGTRTLLHCVCGKVTQETLDAAYFGGRILTYKLDATGTGTLGRTVGYQLGVSGSPGLEADITYGYDALDRFNSLSMLGGPAYTYAYAANSNLISSITDSASGWTETMSYNTTRDLLDSVDGQFSTTHKATFAYSYDTLGRRTSLVSSGEIFDRYSGAGLHNIYSYNDRSEVTGATGYTGQNVSDTSTALKLGGRDFGYSYDPIGNRASSSVDGSATSYSANALNQYTARTSPGATWVTGLAPASATVTVNGATAGRWGDYYALSVAAGSRPLWQSFAVSSSLGGSVTRTGYVAPSPENFSYDLDGNLTDDGRWHYTWDAENRLTSMETSSAAYGVGAPHQLLSFKYDYLGRRVRKTVANWNGSAYVATVDRKFIYDGWNLIAEYDALTTFTLVRSYLWGLDLTRTLQDGGGVGGLLAVVDATTSTIHQPYYDGNGNVHALVNRSTGAFTAAYEYSAFGETLRATGSFAQGNPFRFSSKYTDDETGLLYYGRRYYDPRNGRWVSRDPKEELGGLHLYGFVHNNPVNRWDYLGMNAEGSGYGDDNDEDGYMLSRPVPTGVNRSDDPPTGHSVAPVQRTYQVIFVNSTAAGMETEIDGKPVSLAAGYEMAAAAYATQTKAGPNVIVIPAKSWDDAMTKFGIQVKELSLPSNSITSFSIVDHGLVPSTSFLGQTEAKQVFGGKIGDPATLSASDFTVLKNYITTDGSVNLYGCFVGINRQYMDDISKELGGVTVNGAKGLYPYNWKPGGTEKYPGSDKPRTYDPLLAPTEQNGFLSTRWIPPPP